MKEEGGNGGRVIWRISDDCSKKFGKRRWQSSLDNNLHCETFIVVGIVTTRGETTAVVVG